MLKMQTAKMETLKTFITQRFTAAAVEIFGEVEHLFEEYSEENQKLRELLCTVLGPEMKLHGADQALLPDAASSSGIQRPLRRNPSSDPEEPHPWPSNGKRFKDEQEEYVICKIEEEAHELDGSRAEVRLENQPGRDLGLTHALSLCGVKAEACERGSPSALFSEGVAWEGEEGGARRDSGPASNPASVAAGGGHDDGQRCARCERCGKSFKTKMAARGTKAPVWDHFVEIAPGKAKCGVCDKLISMGSSTARKKNTSNLWSHLKHCHPKAHSDALKKKFDNQKKVSSTGHSPSDN